MEYLKKHYSEFRHFFCFPVEKVVHPIHDQPIYLTSEHKRNMELSHRHLCKVLEKQSSFQLVVLKKHFREFRHFSLINAVLVGRVHFILSQILKKHCVRNSEDDSGLTKRKRYFIKKY